MNLRTIFYIVLAFLLLSSSLFAQGIIDLAQWEGSVSWTGYETSRFGVASASGDFNGDGFWDLAISAPGDLNNSGTIYLYYGPFEFPEGFHQIFITDPGFDAEVVLLGEPESQLGIQVLLGDLNGDGMDELIASSPLADNGKGQVWVVFGTNALDGQEITEPDIRILGAAENDECGKSIGISRLNDNASFDLIIGSPFADPLDREAAGRVDVLLDLDGERTLIDLATDSTDFTIFGAQARGFLGSAVSSAIYFGEDRYGNNINEDGYGDLIVSAPGQTFAGRVNAGVVHVFVTNQSLRDTVDLANMQLRLGYKYFGGAQVDDFTGTSLTAHSYGQGSLFIGAPSANEGEGVVYETTWSLADQFPGNSVDLRIFDSFRTKYVGSQPGDSLGANILATDGLVVFSAPSGDHWELNRNGALYVLEDNPELLGLVQLDTVSSQVQRVFGASSNAGFGKSLAILDIDDNGILDYFAGAPRSNQFAGKSYAIRGGLPFIYNLSPMPGQTGVSVTAPFRFSIGDNTGFEVNDFQFATLFQLEVDHTFIPLINWLVEDTEYDFEIHFAPPLELNVPIDVNLYVTDEEGNRSPEYHYQFVTGVDRIAPTFAFPSPEPDEQNVATNTTVEFSLIDGGTGVDIGSLELLVDGVEGIPGRNLAYTGAPDNYRIVYTHQDVSNPDWPQVPDTLLYFPADEEIAVRISVRDLTEPTPNALVNYQYSFYTVGDASPPEIIEILPVVDAFIDISTPIEIILDDELTGVDRLNTILTLNGIPRTLASEPTANGIRFLYDPLVTGEYYAPGLLDVSLTSQDLARPVPNLLPETNWSYTVVEDILSPVLLSVTPEPFEEGVARNAPIIFILSDNAAGINEESLFLEINGVDAQPNELSFVPQGRLNGSVLFQIQENTYADTVEVHFRISDMALNANELDTTFIFYTELDEQGPTFFLIDPQPFTEGVTINDSLVWEVGDNLTGTDPLSARLTIDDEVYQVNETEFFQFSPTTVTPESEYRFVFNSPEPYSYEDTLSILMEVFDLEEPANPSELDAYELYTQPDEDPPFLTNLYPYRGQSAISRGADIIFHVLDNGVGVDRNSIQLVVEDEMVSFADLFIEDVERGYAVRYNPPGLFMHFDTINVHVRANDLAMIPNILNDEYYFVTLSDDREPPVVQNLVPEIRTGLAIDFSIEFDLIDAGAGADTTRTFIRRPDDPGWTPVIEITPVDLGFHYSITPSTPYLYSDTLNIEIITQDLADPPNQPLLPYTYSFQTVRDDISPHVIRIFPAQDSSITRNRFISINLLDNLAGVDSSTIELAVNGTTVEPQVYFDYYYNDWVCRYRPADFWPVGDSYVARLRVRDFSKSRNQLEFFLRFQVAPDTLAPYVLENSLYPAPGERGIPLDTVLTFSVMDDGLGVDSSSVRFTLLGRSYGSFLQVQPIPPDSLGYTFRLPLRDAGLFAGQWVDILIQAADGTTPPNQMDSYRYNFQMVRPAADLQAVPTTITPNGDGIWDETLIYHPGDPSTEVQIFDYRGRKITSVVGNPAVWNGRDDNGNLVPGGIYIFQLKAKGETRQGTIAVAR